MKDQVLSIRSCSPHPCYFSSFFPTQTFRPHSGTFRTSHGIHHSILLAYVLTHLHTHTHMLTPQACQPHASSPGLGVNVEVVGQGAEELLRKARGWRTSSNLQPVVGSGSCLRPHYTEGPTPGETAVQVGQVSHSLPQSKNNRRAHRIFTC